MKSFNDIDKSIIDFWSAYNITEKDMHCRKCGALMIDVNELSDVEVKMLANNKLVFHHISRPKNTYVESPQNMWCIKGRELSGKTYFRHLCWDCLKKEIVNAIEHNDELHLISPSRFLKWKRMLANGKINAYLDKFPPPPWNSPIWWFRLIFDMTEEELNAERKKFDTASIDSFVRRYGEEKGRKRYDEYVKLQARAGCTLDYFIEKYGEELGKAKYDEVCLSKGVSRKNCIEKYGKEIGEKFFNDYCSVQSYAGVSLKWFIDKLGEIEGRKKYQEVCNKKLAFKGYSNISQLLFELIDNKLGIDAEESKWECKNHEFEVFANTDGINHLYKVDYFLNGKIIEFNGDIWHANPKKYKSDDIVVTPGNKTFIAKDVWERDAKRKTAIEALGFKVHVVWESDYADDPERTVNECVKFLRD